MNGPILVTGGAGSAGRQVALRLHSEGYTVRVLDLPGRDFTGLEGEKGVEAMRGDLTVDTDLRKAAGGVSAVVHLAALMPPVSEKNRALTLKINAEATAGLARALKEISPGVPLVFSSSVSTYGDTTAEKTPVGTGHPQRALDIYAESKIAAEGRLLTTYPDAVILRISGISVPVVQSPPDVWPFTAEQRIEFVYRDDVVTALCAAAVTAEAKGKVFNIAGGPTWRTTGRAYVKDYYDLLGVPIEEAHFQDRPGWFDWYDTGVSQRVLNYQNTTYAAYLDQVRAQVEKMFG